MVNAAALYLAAPGKVAIAVHVLPTGSYAQKSLKETVLLSPNPTYPFEPIVKQVGPPLSAPGKLAF